ncbi:MAG: helix-turn-helix domain-containing protein [Gammaproteobacteria bacterium]
MCMLGLVRRKGMPWQEVSTMSLRTELVMLAMHEGVSVAGLSRRFGISRKTAYKYLRRYAREGLAGLVDRSRRPHRSPRRTVALNRPGIPGDSIA